MTWKVKFDERTRKELRKLDQATQSNILHYLRERIATKDDLRRFGDPLRKNLSGFWKYRIGAYDPAPGVFYISPASGNQMDMAVKDALPGVISTVHVDIKPGNRGILLPQFYRQLLNQLPGFRHFIAGKIHLSNLPPYVR